MFALKRVYDKPAKVDGYRVLVDRLWPRGVARAAARIDVWAKELAPSEALRREFHAGALAWADFARRYRKELAGAAAAPALAALREKAKAGTVTLLYARADTVQNNATVLREVLEGGA